MSNQRLCAVLTLRPRRPEQVDVSPADWRRLLVDHERMLDALLAEQATAAGG